MFAEVAPHRGETSHNFTDVQILAGTVLVTELLSFGKCFSRFWLACWHQSHLCIKIASKAEDGHAENVVKGSFHCAPLSVSNAWNLRNSEALQDVFFRAATYCPVMPPEWLHCLNPNPKTQIRVTCSNETHHDSLQIALK